MSTSENSFTVGAPYVRQVTEQAFERDAAGAYAREVTLPGFIELCVDVNGVPWVVARRKAPGLLADIQRANDQQAQTAAAQPQPQATQPETAQPAQAQPQGSPVEPQAPQAEQPQQPTG